MCAKKIATPILGDAVNRCFLSPNSQTSKHHQIIGAEEGELVCKGCLHEGYKNGAKKQDEADEAGEANYQHDQPMQPDRNGTGDGLAFTTKNALQEPSAFPEKLQSLYESNLGRICRKVLNLCYIHFIHFPVQVALWTNFPDSECAGIDEARIQSIATLLRESGEFTEEANKILVMVVAQWLNIEINLRYTDYNSPNFAAGINLLVRESTQFDIMTSFGRVIPPPLASSDPYCSVSIIRAIAGAVCFVACNVPATVYQETNCLLTLILTAKPNHLILAQNIWNQVLKDYPQVKLGDHTVDDSMGSINFGTMFKVCSLLKAQGALDKYIL
jgi:hypothetical protein